MTDLYSIDIPGSMTTYLQGSSLLQEGAEGYSHDPQEVANAQAFADAWHSSVTIKRGRGTAYRVLLTRGAVSILRDFADMCEHINLFGDKDPSELRAARQILSKCDAILK